MTQNIDKKDYIWICDGYIVPASCDRAIQIFKEYENRDIPVSRQESENAAVTVKKDDSICIPTYDVKNDLKDLYMNLTTLCKKYCDEYGFNTLYGGPDHELQIQPGKIQKTKPGGGYHIWHVEKGSDYSSASRVLVFTIYLNDIEDGGETEFLYQHVRAKPVKGRVVIWPANFPYLHRGNPPLKEDKYIITGWIGCPLYER